jgi:hypothetical protein
MHRPRSVRKNTFLILLALTSLLCLLLPRAKADIVYQSGPTENNFIPFGVDGTPGQPSPGDVIGTEIVLSGSIQGSTLTQIKADMGTNSSSGGITGEIDTYTLQLYLNNGPADPGGSGLLEPGTLFYQTTATASNAGGVYTVTFNTPVFVPQSFTLAISSSHPIDTWSTSAGLVGPLTTTSAPTIGSALDTLWYGSASSGAWETNSTWALADGASTNYLGLEIDATSGLTAIPEPDSALLAFAGAGLCFAAKAWPIKKRLPHWLGTGEPPRGL